MKKFTTAAVVLAVMLTITGCTATSAPTKPTPTTAKTADSATTSPAEKVRASQVIELDEMVDGSVVSAKKYASFRLSPSDTSRTPYVYEDLSGKTRVYHAYSTPGDSNHVRRPVPLPPAVVSDLQQRLDAIREPTLDDGPAMPQKLVELARSIPDAYHLTFVTRAAFPADASEGRRVNWLAVTAPTLSSSGNFVDSDDDFVGESNDRARIVAGAEAKALELARTSGRGENAYPVIAQNR